MKYGRSSNGSSFQLSIGVFRKIPIDSTYYYSTARLNERAIKTHFESLKIDLETTAPSILAKSMAQALDHGMKTPTQKNYDFSETCVSLPLYYEDIQGKKDLVLGIESNAMLDAATASMILSNTRNYNTDSYRNGKDQDTESCDADEFERLLLGQLDYMHKKEKEQKADSEKEVQPKLASEEEKKDLRRSPNFRTTTRETAPRPKFARATVGAMKNRRKKAKTLSYS
eukprot:CAMPEP_0194255818 /NCGR_PEP_ID=MMETSP0158-20130606/35386_1 /TAXON_ID=33649 /ORGANISM="Thalassionema nitzschioides, Strain L26-B" /LENGTH=226 /DNA_ID=CAMNT_0038994293 /DNA_START=84 /DNA_END=760 /DNA_ORIENTATION=-